MSARRAIAVGSALATLAACACAAEPTSSGVPADDRARAPQSERALACSPVPLVRAPHECPYRASRDELSGWVYLRFALTPDGRPSDITVVEADPPGVFDQAALKAVSQYRYEPCLARPTRPIEIVLEWKGCNTDFGPWLELEPPERIQHR